MEVSTQESGRTTAVMARGSLLLLEEGFIRDNSSKTELMAKVSSTIPTARNTRDNGEMMSPKGWGS